MKSFVLTAFEQKWQVRVEEHAKLDNANGLFDPAIRTIFINPQLNHSNQLSVLLHEVIHLIEYYWQFELGKHKAFDLEIVKLIEEGIIQILRENKIEIP